MKEQIKKTLKELVYVNPNDLKFGAEYQRMVAGSKVKKIGDMIDKYGYDSDEVIIVNQDMVIIDGQHRTKAAINAGIKQVPVTVVQFKTLQAEAEYFACKNDWNTKLKPVDYWHAKYIAGNPTANVLYKLESNVRSPLFERIAILGKDSHATKFSIGQVLMILDYALGVNNGKWTRSASSRLDVACRRLGYDYIESKVNKYINFFFDCFGSSKKANPAAYRDDSLYAFRWLYPLLEKYKTTNKRTAHKLSQFVFTADFFKIAHGSRILILLDHVNKGRKKKIKPAKEII